MRIVLILLTILLFSNQSYGQCCAAGNPVNTDVNFGFYTNSLSVSTIYRHSLSTDYYNGSTPDPEYNYMERTYYDFQSVELSYQYKKIRVNALSGYFYNKNQEFGNGYKRPISGLGDLTLSGMYNISELLNNTLSVLPGIGVVLPTGEFDVMVDNIVAPIDAQPSAGALRINGSLLLAKSFLNTRLNIHSYNFIEHSNTIQSDRTKDYKYGNLYVNTIGVSYGVSKWFKPAIQFRSEYRKKAIDKGEVKNATGGHTVFASAKARFVHNDMAAHLAFDLPMYKYVNGQQLTNKYIVSVGVSYRFNLKNTGFKAQDIKLKESADLDKISIAVRGQCAMCTDRIEKIASSIKHVEFAQYNLSEQSLTIFYKKQPDVNVLIEALKEAGHDNEFGQATDEAYEDLHGCCKYER